MTEALPVCFMLGWGVGWGVNKISPESKNRDSVYRLLQVKLTQCDSVNY